MKGTAMTAVMFSSGEFLYLGHEGGCVVVFVVLFMVFGLFGRWNIWGFLPGVRIDIGLRSTPLFLQRYRALSVQNAGP
jgi:hypothetical protein